MTLAQETFICEVEIIREELRQCELIIEGEFVTEEEMEKWGWSERLDCMFDHRWLQEKDWRRESPLQDPA